MTVTALVGAQMGSEGKGLVVSKIAHEYGVHIRTGGPNAGHTFYHEGRKWVARSVPCGWINPDAFLFIGPGALLDANLLLEEIDEIESAGYSIKDRLFVDLSAGIIDPVRHHHFEGGINGYAHQAIGSTGEGVGPARMARIARGTFPSLTAWAKLDLVKDSFLIDNVKVADTAVLANSAIDEDEDVLLEGTQGSGLSLVHGDWPYCTSTDTNAGQLLTDAGISPLLLTEVILVARTFPIRVAGNSGPLPNECSWDDIGVLPERTTVTKKIRRVGRWDDETIEKAINLNRAPNKRTSLVITFMDYLFPEVANGQGLSARAIKWIGGVEDRLDVEVIGVGTGPDHLEWLNKPAMRWAHDG